MRGAPAIGVALAARSSETTSFTQQAADLLLGQPCLSEDRPQRARRDVAGVERERDVARTPVELDPAEAEMGAALPQLDECGTAESDPKLPGGPGHDAPVSDGWQPRSRSRPAAG